MRRSRISCLIPGTVLAAFVCIMTGLELYPKSQGSATDSGSQIRENTKNAAMTMRSLCNAEVAWQWKER